MARKAGDILARYFGKSIEVEYKQKRERDPVTTADRESQEYLKEAISRSFPEHGILSEEDSEEQKEPAPDTVWVLDPLDGTTNFLNGLPLYAVSIGVLHQGIPVVGALYIPWPSSGGGVVLHARKGGGAFVEGDPLSIGEKTQISESNRLSSLPTSFGAVYRFRKGMRGKVGEVRHTGSIAYELSMAALGVFKYVLTTGPHLWDVAAGTLLVLEAGGTVLVRPRGSKGWQPVNALVPEWQTGAINYETLRKWSASLIYGTPQAAQLVAEHLQRRRRPLSQVVRGMFSRVRAK